MTESLATVVVLAKRPEPGRAKTRLTPPFDPDQAAALAAAALADTLDAVDRLPVANRLLAFDGDPAGWLRPGWLLAPQPSGGLDVRITAAFAACPAGPALLVGMDTPQLSPADLTTVDLGRHDACLGPAADGGYWAIGFADPSRAADAVPGVPMSTDHTGARQLARLRSLGLSVQELPMLADVDTAADAAAIAALAPRTRFAARFTAFAAVTIEQAG